MKSVLGLLLLLLPVLATEPQYFKLTKQSCTIAESDLKIGNCDDKKTKTVANVVKKAIGYLSENDKDLLNLYGDKSIEIVDRDSFNTKIEDYANGIFVLSSPKDKEMKAVFPIYIGKETVLEVIEKNQYQDAVAIMLSGAIAHEIEHLRGKEEKEAHQAAIKQIKRTLEMKLDGKIKIMVTAFLRNLENEASE